MANDDQESEGGCASEGKTPTAGPTVSRNTSEQRRHLAAERRRAAKFSGTHVSPIAESIRRSTELNEEMMRSLEPFGGFLRHTAELREIMAARLEPIVASIRRATELNERAMCSLDPFRESLRRTAELRGVLMSCGLALI